MEKRSEEDRITQAPILVILGGAEYKVAPLVIKKSREWRKKVIALISPLPGLSEVDTGDMDSFQNALTIFLVTMPDQVIELFFEYATELGREEIESKATDAELAKAFEEVIAVAFPLAQSAPDVLLRLYPESEKKKKKPSP